MKITPNLEDYFYHDGRGPELQNVVWARNGVVLVGFEYFNPDDEYRTSLDYSVRPLHGALNNPG